MTCSIYKHFGPLTIFKHLISNPLLRIIHSVEAADSSYVLEKSEIIALELTNRLYKKEQNHMHFSTGFFFFPSFNLLFASGYLLSGSLWVGRGVGGGEVSSCAEWGRHTGISSFPS